MKNFIYTFNNSRSGPEPVFRIASYQLSDGSKPFWQWLKALKDRSSRTRILSRFDRLILGHFGDCKPVGEGVFELRFHFGPGYRVYYGSYQQTIVVLLWGGDKKTQPRDVKRAQEYWKDFLRRKDEALG